MMKLCGVYKFRSIKYASDMPEAWAARAMGGAFPRPETANFRTSEGRCVRTANGILFNVKEVN